MEDREPVSTGQIVEVANCTFFGNIFHMSQLVLVLDYTPKARAFIANELGYPDFVTLVIPLGMYSVHWCTKFGVRLKSRKNIKNSNTDFLTSYGVGIYLLTNTTTADIHNNAT